MNPSLEPYIKKLLDGGMKTAEEVANFVEIQAPELGREMIVWGAISNSLVPFIGLIMIVFGILFYKKFKNSDWMYECSLHPPGMLVTIFSCGIGFIMFCVNIMSAIFPLVAPRLYILEKISSLIK